MKFLSLLFFVSLLSACGMSGGGATTSLSAAQVGSGTKSLIASFSVGAYDQAQVASGTNTCLNTDKQKDYVSAIQVSVQANPSVPTQTVTITSMQLLSTLNTWETLPISVTLKAGASSGWLQLGNYGNRCFSQVMLEAATNGGDSTVQVSALLQH